MTDDEIVATLESLRATAQQQPISYHPLYKVAMKIAESQFKRALNAEKKLQEINDGRARL